VHPAWSVIFFTTLIGWAQGLVVALSIGILSGRPPTRELLLCGLAVATVMSIVALGCSFLHLGRPGRAWRSVMMWRTSWLSREVIAAPAFIGWISLWLLAESNRYSSPLFPPGAIALALLLWLCTAMIYACLKFIQEWSHPLTLANYTLLGLGSGMLLTAALAVVNGDNRYAIACSLWGAALTALALVVRSASLTRNRRLRPASTLQTATGIRTPELKQMSMGMTGGAFNTREFFHGKSLRFVRYVKALFIALAFVAPIAMVVISVTTQSGIALIAAAAVQYLGLLAERWYFFAEARHPQNLYYQAIA
jgi:DMSO reductase anchor subunit